jgi:hypothetical protein
LLPCTLALAQIKLILFLFRAHGKLSRNFSNSGTQIMISSLAVLAMAAERDR